MFRSEGIPGIVEVRFPKTTELFTKRAERFRSLASGSVLADYLNAMASLADAQKAALADVQIVADSLPPGTEFPLNPMEWNRGNSWRRGLKTILGEMELVALPAQSRAALEYLSGISSEEIERSADALLAGNYAQLELSSGPFIGAALQVYWTSLAGAVPVSVGGRCANACPVCTSPPVAGMVLGDTRLRYLVCSLCSTEWYLPRLTCSNCGSTEGISYLSIEMSISGAKAECCGRCNTYLKLLYRESVPAAEPFADDAATLALDMLVSEEKFSRIGPNLYLLPGFSSAHD